MTDILPAHRILPQLQASSKKEAICEFAAAVHAEFPALDLNQIINALLERESLGSTGIGEGAAIPHAKLGGLKEMVVYFGRSFKGIMYEAIDGKPVHFFFLLLAPEDMATPYLGCLARISIFIKSSTIRSKLLKAATRDELARILSSPA